MEDVVKKSELFLDKVLYEIFKEDKLHFKTLSTDFMTGGHFNYIRSLIYNYFTSNKIGSDEVVWDYLQMIADMRRETAYFIEHGRYSCISEQMACDRVYNHPDKMITYMNALMISQILWEHHFKMLQFFNATIIKFFRPTDAIRVLDIGAGHALLSVMIVDNIPYYKKIDIIDLSDISLRMASQMLTDASIECFKTDVMNYIPKDKYDLVIMGEVLEHIENPLKALNHVKTFLKDDGLFWLTIPTNAPAIDHIYLFQTKKEICETIENAGLQIIEDIELEVKNTTTKLIGIYCTR